MESFVPTLDWGHELWTSLIWVARAWVIAAIATLIIVVLIARFTTWGRQFWRITGGYFKGPESLKVWLWLGALLLSVIVGVRLSVLFTFQGSDMMTSFQVVAAGVAEQVIYIVVAQRVGRGEELQYYILFSEFGQLRRLGPCLAPIASAQHL